jgi:hypothetical protein
MSSATVTLAPHVGRYVAATDLAEGALLAVALAAGARGEHRVSVLDTQTWSLVATFPIPSRARSGVTPLHASGELLFANDDHTVSARVGRTGALVWERAFPAPLSVRLLDVAGERLLVSIAGENPLGETRLLRAADGADDAVLPATIVSGIDAVALGRDGTLVVAGMRVVDVFRADQPRRRLDLVTKRYGAVDAAALDATGARVVIGTRAGEVLVMELASGATTTVLEMEDCVRSVGFLRGAPWALDAAGRLRVVGDAGLRVDVGLQTYGGILSQDGATLSLGAPETRTFRVRRLPSNEELFTTTPGFACDAVGIDAEGALLVSDGDKVLRLDAQGKLQKLTDAATEITRLADGALLFAGTPARVLARGAKKVSRLAKRGEDLAVVGGVVLAMSRRSAELWDLASATRTWSIDLDKTWVGETNEALRLVHLGPDGRPWLHLSDGGVFRADAIGSESGYVGRLPVEGALWVHPDGASLYRTHERALTRVSVDGLVESAPLDLAVDADVGKLVFSPSGRRLVVFHLDGRLSSLDLASGRAVAIDTPETSASERASHELYGIDLETPHGCAFGRDEVGLAWTHAGGVTFANADTGALTGRLVIATSGRDYVLTDGAAFDWPGAPKKPISAEIVALEAGAALPHAALATRRDAALLGRLTR